MKKYIHPNKFFMATPFYDGDIDIYYYELKTRFANDVSEGYLFCSENDIKSL